MIDLASETAAPTAAARSTRALAVASLMALVALGLAWELVLAPTGSGTLAIKVLPLALCLTGLLKFRMKTYRVTALLVWLYVTEGLVRAVSDTGLGARLAIVEIVLALLLFGACSAHIRLRLAAGRT